MKKFDFDIGLAEEDDVDLDADLTKQIDKVELKEGGRKPGGANPSVPRITSVVSDIQDSPYDIQ